MKNNSTSSKYSRQDNDNFLIASVCSIAMHLLLFYFLLFGLPAFLSTPIQEEQIIAFEMLPISPVANIPLQQKKVEKPVESENAKKVLKTKAEPVEQEIPKEKPVEKEPLKEEKPELKEEPKDSEAEVIKVEKKKPEEKPKEEKKKEPEQPKPKEKAKPPEDKKLPKPKDKKKKPVMDNNDIDALLKNLEKTSEGASDKSDKRSQKQGEAKQTSKGKYNEDKQLSIDLQNVIRHQLQKFWSPPIGSQNIENSTISASLKLDQNGNVLEVRIVSKSCPDILNSTCQALAESVERAILQASPLQNLPLEHYADWQEFNVDFSPKDLY